MHHTIAIPSKTHSTVRPPKMALNRSYCCVLLLLALFLITALSQPSADDPELRTCRHQCRHQQQFGEAQRRRCERDCERYIKQKQERRQERESRRGEEEEEQQQRGTDDNPYVFSGESFETKFENQHGRERVLPGFTKVSDFLKGIENFRVEIFEAKPFTFALPRHVDADAFFFVANGRGTITVVSAERRESFNIERGHVMKVPAGFSAYLINRDADERLVLVKLFQPVANPGKFESFFGAGGSNPESFVDAFGADVAEALFKAPRDRLQQVFGKQEQEGVLKRASKEQIRALSKQDKEGHWPFGQGGAAAGSPRAPFNIFRQRPTFSNEFGTLFELDSDDFKQLRDTNMQISFANITQGGMHTLFYNTRATKIAVVVGGKGRFQMACPHISGDSHQNDRHGRRQSGESDTHYERVSADLKVGTVFVVPAGHPFVTIASKEDDLEVICFEVNADDNERVLIAGEKSVFKQWEKEAKELAFEEKAEAVDELSEKQSEEFFFEGPRRRRQRESVADE